VNLLRALLYCLTAWIVDRYVTTTSPPAVLCDGGEQAEDEATQLERWADRIYIENWINGIEKGLRKDE
jgi:thioredoxin reductase